MKGGNGIPTGIIHKRLYTVLPRTAVLRRRSNSASLYTSSNNVLPLSFFDSPPPSSRLHPHPAPKPKQQSTTNPNPIALLSDHPDSTSPSLHPQLSPGLSHPSRPISPSNPSATTSTSSNPPRIHPKRPRNRYQLDVGAYGIPKRNQHHRPSSDAHLAVQIGEDAYFVRDNAMGVADGVGGWARSCPSSGSSSPSHRPHTPVPSPSALFARRLMHYTSAQLDVSDPFPNEDTDDAAQSLDSHLEDLADGIDVLQILEQAYSQTVKAHVEPSSFAPLHVGSSTALVAVLDHDHSVDIGVATSDSEDTPISAINDRHQDETISGGGPVLKIAHVGDCMGMLVRGDAIVWRSDEMWWAFNTPVQLAPPPPPPSPSRTPSPPPPQSTLASLFHSLSRSTPRYDPQPTQIPPQPAQMIPTPRNSAQILTLPVQADDILILASDGLSDNLWDEDVLDEVARFRKMWADAAPLGMVNESRPRASLSRPVSPFVNDAHIPTPVSPSAQIYAHASASFSTSASASASAAPGQVGAIASTLHRHTLAAMLSEALCSRARRVSELRRPEDEGVSRGRRRHPESGVDCGRKEREDAETVEEDETPFARRAREAGRVFFGGKRDDISVLVAVIAPAPGHTPTPTPLHTPEESDHEVVSHA